MTAPTNGNAGAFKLPRAGLANNSPLGAVPPGIDPSTADKWLEIVHNVVTSRSELFSKALDCRRDVYFECGYPNTGALLPSTYRDLYDREPIATRVVECLPKESWQLQPLVYETDDSEVDTPFEEAWDALGKGLTGGTSWHKEEKGSPVWEYLLRTDILAGIGHFGVLLLGLDDGRNLEEPVDGATVVINRHAAGGIAEAGGAGGAGAEIVANVGNPSGWVCDSPLFEGEAEKLKATLPNLTANERRTIERWERDRERLAGLQAQAQEQEDRLAANRIMQASELVGTDAQYQPSLFAAPQPGTRSGTEQQYFGVQFGPSEAPAPEASKQKRKLLFLRAFDESLVQIVRYEWDVRNPRFGQPVVYRITLNDPREQHSGIGLPMATVFVHWSRVIHVCDDRTSSEIFGTPRLRPVLNRILDLRKVYAADGEACWKNAVMKLIVETHPTLGGDVDVNTNDLKGQLENFFNSLQPYMALMGMTAKTVAPAIADPTPHVAVQIEAICIKLGIPVRVFKGSERGELASSQDDASWNDRLRSRQMYYITPRIIVPFIDRLILVGALPEPKAKPKEKPGEQGKAEGRGGKPAGAGAGNKPPAPYDETVKPGTEPTNAALAYDPEQVNPFRSGAKDPAKGVPLQLPYSSSDPDEMKGGASSKAAQGKGSVKYVAGGYCIEWPDLDSQTDAGRAAVLLQRTQAYAAYKAGQLESMVSPKDYLTKFDTFDEDTADNMLANAADAHAAGETMTMPPQIAGRPMSAPPGTAEHDANEFRQKNAEALLKIKAQQPQPGSAGGGKGGPPPSGGAGKPPGGGGAGEGPDLLGNAADESTDDSTENAFCATGQGGGVDPSCSPSHSHSRAEVEAMSPVQRKAMAKMLLKMDVSGKTDAEITEAIHERGPEAKSKPQVSSPAAPAPKLAGNPRYPFMLAGANPAAYDTVAAAKRKADAGDRDPLKLKAEGPPPGTDLDSLRTQILAAVDKHAAVKGVGLPFTDLYAAVGQSAGLSKREFMRAVTALDGKPGVRFGGHSKPIDQLPDPELVTFKSGDVISYLKPSNLAGNEAADTDDATENVFCATGPGGGINPHCSSGGFQSLNTHDGLVDYVKKAAAAAGIKVTQLYLDKIKAFNPNGITSGTVYFPSQGSKASQDKHLQFFMKAMPAGTIIKSKDVSATTLATMLAAMPKTSAATPAASAGSSPLHRGANVITGTPGGSAATSSSAPTTPAPTSAKPSLPHVPFATETHWKTGEEKPGTLNGVDFKPAPPKFWEKTKDVDVKEPPPIGKIDRVGVMIQEPDGRVWIVQPTNGFGNRKFTMPGGGVEKGLTNQQNALKEVWEETGLQVEITGHLGDFKDSNNGNNGRLYIGKRVGGAPWDAKIESFIIDRTTGKPAAESSHVSLVTKERAAELLHRTDDLAQLATVAPIKINAKSNGEMMKKIVDGLAPQAKQYEREKKAKGEAPGSSTLHVVQELRGFNDKPDVVSKADMDKLVAAGTHIELLRGIKDIYGSKHITGKEMAEQFKTGEHFPGFGCFGNGTYADATKGYSNVAAPGGSYQGSATIRMALPKTAKIIEQSELERLVGSAPSNFDGKDPATGWTPHTADRQWQGIQAALAGYDAIHVDGKSAKQGTYGNPYRSKTEGFYVILNRSVLTVQKEDAKGHTIS